MRDAEHRLGWCRGTALSKSGHTAFRTYIAWVALTFYLAAPVQARCAFGKILCEDGYCYDLGASCCRGGGACAAGSNCWATGSGATSHCCKLGSQGYRDGGCAPIGISDYCGRSTYCMRGRCTADGGCRTN